MPHCYVVNPVTGKEEMEMCQCPHGLIPHFYIIVGALCEYAGNIVSMPSRAGTSFLRGSPKYLKLTILVCQYPLGLVPHFYHFDVWMSEYANNPYQCPHGLVPHFYVGWLADLVCWKDVSMPSRASTSFLHISKRIRRRAQ